MRLDFLISQHKFLKTFLLKSMLLPSYRWTQK